MYIHNFQPNSHLEVTPIGGYSHNTNPNLQNYLIVFENNEKTSSQTLSRGALVSENLHHSQVLIDDLRKWLKEQKIDNRDAIVGEPTTFSMVSLTATPDVAKAIESYPTVDAVILD